MLVRVHCSSLLLEQELEDTTASFPCSRVWESFDRDRVIVVISHQLLLALRTKQGALDDKSCRWPKLIVLYACCDSDDENGKNQAF